VVKSLAKNNTDRLGDAVKGNYHLAVFALKKLLSKPHDARGFLIMDFA